MISDELALYYVQTCTHIFVSTKWTMDDSELVL